MKKLLLFCTVSILAFVQISFSQTETNVEALQTFAEEKAIEYNQKKAEALEYAANNNIPVRFEADKTQFELQYIDESGKPIYYITHNANAAATISTNRVYSGGGAGLSLDGSGITVREWDAGAVRVSHQEYGGRVVIGDGASTTHYHATHVAGTIMAAGVVASAKGMAYNANLRAFDWNNDASEMATEGANGCLMSNHSYGFGRGWTWNGWTYVWNGNSSISSTEDYQFGFYNSYSQQYDQIAYNAPNYLICVSAGNDRNEGPNSSPPNDGPYDCIADYAISKNTLTVGAVNDIPGGYTSPSSVVMSSFSSWGPADDGRVKPDIVANGVSLYSTDDDHNSDYQTLSGTSMSSPSATGSVALLQQHHNNLTGSYMRSATLKALVIHTADEAGSNTGPDYEFGWGLMNTESAALKISEDQTLDVISEHTLSNGGTYTRNVTALGAQPLKVTIVWTDYPGTPVSAQLDPITPMIKNELDLKITLGGSTYYPWKLNRNSPTAAATNTGENNVDNVEVVYIATPSAGASYTITVDHDGSLTTGSQAFSVIISGIAQSPPVADFTAGNTTPANSSTWVNFTDLSTNTPTSWSWSFSSAVTYQGGTSFTSQNPIVSFNNFGAYTVTLTATNAGGSDSEIKTDYIHVGTPGTWTGATTTNWNTTTNWENHMLPIAATDVSITPAAFNWPTKTGNLTIGTDCNSLNMSGGYTELTVTGDLTISSGKTFYVDPTGIPNIIVGGNWTDNGTFTPGNETVEFNGSNTATMNSSSGNLSFWDLDINKANATLTANCNVNINNDLTVRPGAWFTNATGNTMNVTGNADFEGNASGKASFVDNGTFNVGGTTTVQSYYNDLRWHFISSPVSSAVSNIFLGIYLKEWNENNYTWTYITATNHPLDVGKGFEIWSTLGNPTIDYTGGVLNTGNISPAVTATDQGGNSSIDNGEGWNFVSNPYPCAIDLGNSGNPLPGYTWTNLDSTVYFWNSTQYAEYNPKTDASVNGGTRYVPSMQGFFVKAHNFSPAMTIPNSSRLHSTQANYKSSGDNQLIRLIVEGNGYSDETLILVYPGSTQEFDPGYDAYKLWGIEEAPQLYSIVTENILSINTLPEIVEETIVELGLKVGNEAQYTITLTEVVQFEDIDFIILEDMETGTFINLLEEPAYSFTAVPGNDPHRFNLYFTDITIGLDENLVAGIIQIYSLNKTIYIQNPEKLNGDIIIYDMLGQEIIRKKIENEELIRIKLTQGTGYYLVKVQSDEQLVTEKVFIR